MADDFNPTEWLTTKEAAELTGYTTSYIRKAIYRGRLTGKKLGRDWILKKDEVLAYAEKMKELGPSKHDPWRTGARESETED